MTHRFPHDFWSGRHLDLEPGYRFDGSLPQGVRPLGPYGFTRGSDWETLNPQEEILLHFIDETVLDEVDEEPLDEGPHAGLTEDLHPAAAKTGFFIPEQYEPNYPYPVILWFHDAGQDESDLLSLMPQVSTRNYFGLSLRGPVHSGDSAAGFDWPTDAESIRRLEQEIYQTLCELRRNFHIHSERVFLAGVGSGATMALRLLFQRAEWFAGAFALGGELPPFDSQTALHPELMERRIVHRMTASEDQQSTRLWRAAGLNLATSIDDGPQELAEHYRQLNHWVMETICTPV